MNDRFGKIEDWHPSVEPSSWGSGEDVLIARCTRFTLQGQTCPSGILFNGEGWIFSSAALMRREDAGVYAFALEYSKVPVEQVDSMNQRDVLDLDGPEYTLSRKESDELNLVSRAPAYGRGKPKI